MEPLSLILLFFLTLFASAYGSVVGGGGLITTPLLVGLGLPPHIATATSRTGGIPTPIIGMYKFNQRGYINWKIALKISAIGILGFLIGLLLFFEINEIALKILIASISIIGLGFIFIKKDLGIKVRKISNKKNFSGYILVFLIAIYAGLYGAMFATFLSYILVIFFGMTFLQSAGTRKLFGFTRHLITIPFLIWAGKVYFPYVFIMWASKGIGAYIGCHYAPKIGNKKIKYIFIIVTLIAVSSMFY
jgi:hypothetical protein